MSPGIITTKQSPQVAVIRAPITGSPPQITQYGTTYTKQTMGTTLQQFMGFWTLMDTIQQHGYLRASLSTIGRSAIGAWWSLQRHEEYGRNAPDLQRRRLLRFYMMDNRDWTNIKDFQSFAYKLKIGLEYFRYFGQAAYHILRDAEGNPLGLDFLPGLVVPNVDKLGNFDRNVAFIQYLSSNPLDKVEFSDPHDIVYITDPDWRGSPLGGTDFESLSTFTLPIDIYLQTAAREYMRNRDAPEVVYVLSPDTSDESFETFVNWATVKHSGSGNTGKSMVAVQGDFDVKELRPYPSALPYQESRSQSREEELAVAGVNGAKLGLSADLASANLREMRREFHESSMVPLFKPFELAFYEQIHLREFGIRGWELKFHNPDFLTAVEKATVHMRYRQQGVLNANEIRADLGKEPREDDGGDDYTVPKGTGDSNESDGSNNQGSPPEGNPIEPDSPSQTGEPTLDDQDPPRGDQHDETPRDSLLKEIRTWKAMVTNRMKRGKSLRKFDSDVIPDDINELVQHELEHAKEIEDVAKIFNDVISVIEEVY